MDSLYFKEEHVMLRDMVKDFAVNEVRPISGDIDKKSIFPEENIKKMSELGLMGIPWDQKYSGTGMDIRALVIAIEEIGKECASTAATMMAHTSLGTAPIAIFGNDAQKEKYLPLLATGKILGAFGLTEPEAGSDAGNTQTIAIKKGDEYIINGQKVFCTNAGKAGTIIITAAIQDNGNDQGIGAFIIESDNPGLKIGEPENKMGWKGSDTRSIYFEDMKLSKNALLGSPQKGFKQFLQTLTGGRITIGALSLGTAQGAYERAIKYSFEREAFSKQINKFQAISFKLSDMALKIQASKHLVYHAAWKKDKGLSIIKEAAMAKLFASESAMSICTEAIQVLGGYGYIHEYDVERFFRDAKILEIGEGTSEIQRIIIAREILKSYQPNE
mgnify:FL=1|tara:strand:- start:4292 stop:5452 length:1161 start_codon:yes stop_codon:yes gene_type:complete